MSTSAQSVKPTIVLIHGLWLTPKSWEGWIKKFEQAGYKVLAPAWPGMDGDVETIRKNPAALRGMRLMTVVDHYDRIVRGLDAPPILMGHSFGGLIVQLLVDRGLGAAGVVIDSAQSAGVPVLPLSTVRATLSILGNPFTFNKAVSLTPSQFNYAFTNELDATESKKVYDRLAVPGPARILWDGAFSLLNPKASSKVNYRNGKRAPLLFIAGGKDHLVPPAINKANVRKYSRSSALTAYREFPGRTHNTVSQAGWEQVADFALSWSLENSHYQLTDDDVKAAFAPPPISSESGEHEMRM
ncbi:MAG TPA: alpha/beta fold hydrolase [Gemmatimonadaceae bacterium]|nr:alpha/beta fold hydrolase [Gemmatimonadaceae bacterium]